MRPHAARSVAAVLVEWDFAQCNPSPCDERGLQVAAAIRYAVGHGLIGRRFCPVFGWASNSRGKGLVCLSALERITDYCVPCDYSLKKIGL